MLKPNYLFQFNIIDITLNTYIFLIILKIDGKIFL